MIQKILILGCLLLLYAHGSDTRHCQLYSEIVASREAYEQAMKDCLHHIETMARLFYRQQDAFHNEQHGERVVAYALKINQTEQADPFLVEAGAWLHQYHDHLDELRNLLDKTGLSRSIKEQLYEIVRLCRPHLIRKDSPLSARIVFDADAMELMGARGIIRELSCNIRVRGMSEEQAIKATREVQQLFEEKMVTDTGRTMARNPIVTAKQFWADFDQQAYPLTFQ